MSSSGFRLLLQSVHDVRNGRRPLTDQVGSDSNRNRAGMLVVVLAGVSDRTMQHPDALLCNPAVSQTPSKQRRLGRRTDHSDVMQVVAKHQRPHDLQVQRMAMGQRVDMNLTRSNQLESITSEDGDSTKKDLDAHTKTGY